MSDIAIALMPILAVILLGFSLKQIKFIQENAWSGLEKLTYYILFPALLIRVLGNQTLTGTPWKSMLVVVIATLMIAATILISWHRIRHTVSGATFTSIFQGGIRFNAYITLAVAQAFFGREGLLLSTVTCGFMIVVINFLCISVFSVWGESAGSGIKPFIKEIIRNPLLISCGVGWFLSAGNIELFGVIDNILEMIGRAALPFGLLAVGAALNLRAIHGHIKAIVISSTIQFGLKPLTAACIISFTELTGTAAGVLFIALMTPTAPSGYILAKQLGGDTETISSIITFQIVLAFFLMPLIAMLTIG